MVLKKYKPTIIAVTGNVGKTSTKDALYTVLSNAYYVRKSEKSFNSGIGIPLTVLGVNNAWNNPFLWMSNIFEGLVLIFTKNHYPKWLILEVGADRPGLIKKITKWLKPHIVIVTKIGKVPVHIEIFKSRDKLVQEKAALVESLGNDGSLALCADDEYAMSLKNKFSGKVITFGFSDDATLYASNAQMLYDEAGNVSGINFKVNYASNAIPVSLYGCVGYHNTYAVLAALAVSVSQDLNLISAVQWAQKYKTPIGRSRIVGGVSNSVIIDDSYNASPEATLAAVASLNDINARGKKIAVLGDMLELGRHSAEEHENIGKAVANICDMAIFVGLRMKKAGEVAIKSGMKKSMVLFFETSTEAARALKKIPEKNDVILIKGSQGMRMERITKEIMAYPETASSILVRQEPEWIARD